MEKLKVKIEKVQELLEWRVKNPGNEPEPREKTKQEKPKPKMSMKPQSPLRGGKKKKGKK